MARGIKPLEKSAPRVMKLKLGFLLVLIILGIFFSYFYSNRKKPDNVKSEVLGEEIKISDQILGAAEHNIQSVDLEKINQSLEKLNQETQKIKDKVLGQTTTIVEKAASSAASTVSDAVFDRTLKPIVQQVENLPADQKERVKEALCSPR